ncbi:hypothetical protein [Iodidimonas sp. SYSU 1G8]|uniref:portal protein n=1 Tax=Iodidimonas sp. SYSU 1G8 TaxID=3133967 RepID=UPI0031FEFA6E
MDIVENDVLDLVEGEGDAVRGMPEEDLQAIVASEIDDAADYIDNTVSTERAFATDYYWGRPFGNEEEGRSQVVSYDVRDTVQAIMPSLMRVFFAGDNVVEFVPQGPEDEAAARQATDYVNHIVQRDNPGFRVFHAAFKDALIRKAGIIKYWWEAAPQVETWELSGLDDGALAVVMADPEVAVQVLASETAGQNAPGMAGPVLHSVRCTRVRRNGRVRVEAVPPEEFLIDRRAKSIADATFVAHRSTVPAGDLVAMGYDPALVEEFAESADVLDTNVERLARNEDATLNLGARGDEAMKLVLYTEAYVRVDYDGDGMPELRRVCTMGPGHRIVANQPASFRPFVDLCPDPEPHTFFGMSIADVTMDLQRIKSSILRNMLDSLAQSIHPRMAAVEGQVNMDDLLNTEVGGVVRMRQPGMVQPLETPFVGQQAFPVLAYMDEIRENRTGITKAAAGLDADALQSTTRAAVAATITAAQQRVELIARLFAEGGISDLFRGILKLVTAHQDRERVVRLKNRWVAVDPRPWNADMDVTVNVGIGSGTTEEKLMFLSAVAARQEGIIQSMGPANALAGLPQYRNTLARMMELAGYRDASQFFGDPAMAPPAPPPAPPPPDPNVLLAQAQTEQIRADIAKKSAELTLEREKMLRADDRERDKTEADLLLRAAELEAKYGRPVDLAQMRALMERARGEKPDCGC